MVKTEENGLIPFVCTYYVNNKPYGITIYAESREDIEKLVEVKVEGVLHEVQEWSGTDGIL